MKSSAPTIKTTGASAGKAGAAIRSASRQVTGLMRANNSSEVFKNTDSKNPNNLEEGEESSRTGEGEIAKSEDGSFAERLASAHTNTLAFQRALSFSPGTSGGTAASSKASSGGFLTGLSSSKAAGYGWGDKGIAASSEPIVPYGEGSQGGLGNFQDVPENPDLVNFDPDKMPGYDKATAQIREAISAGKINISETNSVVTMGNGIPGGSQARQKFQDHIVHNLAIMTSNNDNLLNHLTTKGLDVTFANSGIRGSAANGGGVGGYMQVGDSDGRPNMVLGGGRGATTIFHEMTHYFDGTDGNGMNGVLPTSGFASTIQAAQNKMRAQTGSLSAKGLTRMSYGLSNDKETLAVLGENYFAKNALFRQEFPQMAEAFDSFFGSIDGQIQRGSENNKSGELFTQKDGGDNSNNINSSSISDGSTSTTETNTAEQRIAMQLQIAELSQRPSKNDPLEKNTDNAKKADNAWEQDTDAKAVV